MPSKPSGQGKNTAKRPAVSKLVEQRPPDWPPLKPLVPTCDLTPDTILDDQIVVIRNFFTPTLCKQYVSFLSSLPLITTPAKPKEGDAVRVNDRIQFHDPKFAESLWSSTGLKGLVTEATQEGVEREAADSSSLEQSWGGEVLGLNPNIRIYRYREGQFFAQHCRYNSNLLLIRTSDTICFLMFPMFLGESSSFEKFETVLCPERIQPLTRFPSENIKS